MKTKLLKPTLIFIALAIAGIGISVGSGSLTGEFEQNLLSNLGAAIFGAGLVVFLIEALRWDRQHGAPEK